MKSNKNEELKSRRDFFKKAAKSALPILGAVVLSSTPLISQAAETAMGCAACKGTCFVSCQGDCKGYCKGTCKYECTTSCRNGCRNTCYGGAKYN